MGMQEALEAIRNGKVILIYDFDDREKESDMTAASEFVTYETVRQMRKDAGGLLCTTTPYRVAKAVGLPYLSDVFWDAREKYPVLGLMAPTDIPYDNTKSSFGVTINHRETYTGIPDRDRALTISEFAKTIFQDKPAGEIAKDLGRDFRAPGHVHLLTSSEHILSNRHGHTELASAMMYMAGVKPSATICEMMGDDGNSERKENCIEYSEKNGIPFVTGDEVIAAWAEFKKEHPELDV
ncbi:3,4-dihydroxy-2-butanone 4-phosphate synthase [Thermoplasmatales archaeon BRNA1]|nr:3,4-dihydroxy-2-butanone 4-phosphate synthase [Thermoplasmatales archaeon BRNA1]